MTYDVIIIGSGAGGGTLAYALRNSGAKVLLIERGDFIPQEKENWQEDAVIRQKRYQASETWFDAESGTPFRPGIYYNVGGCTKMYGAAFPRFRREDFLAMEHEEGTSPAWPITYDDLEPYYAQAEKLFMVHGTSGEDPTEPARTSPYPYPALPHEPYMADLAARLKGQGYHPFTLPVGVDLREGGRCIRCFTCDGFPCLLHAKGDAEVCCVRPALQSPDVQLMTRTRARRLITDSGGQCVAAVEVERDGEVMTLHAKTFVVSAGATNSAALLLRSSNDKHPNGLANSSDQVGRNYMAHINSTMIAIDPSRENADTFHKTLSVNDFYLPSTRTKYPLGNLQIMGKIQAGGYIASHRPHLSLEDQKRIAQHSTDWWIMSEDLPHSDNRVTLGSDGSIRVRRRFVNEPAHHRLAKIAEEMLHSVGYTEFIYQFMPIETNSHQCGTIRFGSDPATSALDPFCRAWDLDNLHVVDASFFPSSAAMNPCLTIVAQALRVADHLMQQKAI
jgi:choline dehydrogenase-like flavoprotein